MTNTLIDRITVLRLHPGDTLLWTATPAPTTESLHHFQQEVSRRAGFQVPVWHAPAGTRVRVVRPVKEKP